MHAVDEGWQPRGDKTDEILVKLLTSIVSLFWLIRPLPFDGGECCFFYLRSWFLCFCTKADSMQLWPRAKLKDVTNQRLKLLFQDP